MRLREINEMRTRELIELTARELFCMRGIGETELKDIAGAVGIPRTTLYNYYRDKSELAAAVYLRNLRLMMTHMEAKALRSRIKASGGDFRSFISKNLDAVISNFIKDPNAYIYDFAYNLQAARSHHDPLKLEGHSLEAAEGVALFMELLDAAVQQGHLKCCKGLDEYRNLVISPLLAYLAKLAIFEKQKPTPDFSGAARQAKVFKDILVQGLFTL